MSWRQIHEQCRFCEAKAHDFCDILCASPRPILGPAEAYPNFGSPEIRVVHADLKRFGDSPYRSMCMACSGGLLFVRRVGEDMKLSRHDRCMRCLLPVYYTDAEINGEPFAEPLQETT